MIGFSKFNAEAFRKKIMEYTDPELRKMGRSCEPAVRNDPQTELVNAKKYQLCREEWRRRHPK
jgi:hypothetical protein